MRSTRFLFTLAFALVVAAAPVFAADQATDRRATEIVELRKRTPEQARAIVANLSDADKQTLVREQATIDSLLAATPDPEAMTPEDRQTFQASTQAIDGILESRRAADEEQLICRRERKVGTNFYNRVCRTKAEIEAERQRSRDQADQDRSRR